MTDKFHPSIDVVTITDATTGELYAVTEVDTDDDRAWNDYKGWLLRSRTAYARRTGHKLTVVRTSKRITEETDR